MALDPTEWARTEARSLRGALVSRMATLAPAADFLRSQAGAQSAFYTTAVRAMKLPPSIARPEIADALEGWARYADDELAAGVSFESRARLEASTDLLEQVETRLQDKTVHVAAPIVLAGAALEEFLRSLIAQHGIAFHRKPSISAFADELRKTGALTKQDVKDITSWAGQRNDAAHGDFDQLSRERARIMVDGINLFMRQQGQAPPP